MGTSVTRIGAFENRTMRHACNKTALTVVRAVSSRACAHDDGGSGLRRSRRVVTSSRAHGHALVRAMTAAMTDLRFA